MSRIAVAGAAGFIGSHVVEHLANDHDLVAIDRPGANLSIARAAGATTRCLDLCDPEAAQAAFADCELLVNATGLFDLAASEEQLQAVNVRLGERIVEAARDAGVRRAVHLSSVAVYGAPARVPMGEDGPFNPRNAYERSKRDGERAVMKQADIEVTTLRPTLVYGARSRYGHAMMIAMAAQAAALGIKRLPLVAGGPRGHHVHVHDVARAVELLLFHDDAPGRCFNVADDAPLGVGDSVIAIAEHFGLRNFGSAGRQAWRVLRLLLGVLPERAVTRLNNHLARGHRALERRGMHSELTPRLDRDWLGYFKGEFMFDTGRLKSLGFQLSHPDFRASIGGVIDWYVAEGWLPQPQSHERAA